MTKRRIVRAGHPALSRIADPIADPMAFEIHAVISDMIETLDGSGGIGLAAPQIGEPVRIVIFFVPDKRLTNQAEDVPVGLTVMINPEIEPLDDQSTDGFEGCLSLPGLGGMVPRHNRIRYRFQDPEGASHERIAAGFHARVVQHECDHLDGRLYPSRMTDLRTLVFVDELPETEERHDPAIE